MSSQRPSDSVFAGSVPEIYDRFLVPLIFHEYAVDLATRLAPRCTGPVLEVAAGTGVLTRELAKRLPASIPITASDLNQPMLDHAMSLGSSRPVTWRQADVMALPFDDETFDAVACQFGVMFFPHRPRAFAEIRRVLRPGGVLLFNVWNRIEDNHFARVVTDAVGELFPDDPPKFLARVPHGYHDAAVIRADLAAGGFTTPVEFETLETRSRAATAIIPAVAYCQGTPLRNEIIARAAGRLEEATAAAAAAIERLHGSTDVVGLTSAQIVTVKAAGAPS